MATNKRKDAAALFELLDKSTLKVPKNPNGSLKIPSWWSSKTNPTTEPAKTAPRFDAKAPPTPPGAPAAGGGTSSAVPGRSTVVPPWSAPAPRGTGADTPRSPIGASPVGMIPRAGFSAAQPAVPAAGAISPAGPLSNPGSASSTPAPASDVSDDPPIHPAALPHRLLPGVPAWAWAIGVSLVLIIVIAVAYAVIHHAPTGPDDEANPGLVVSGPNGQNRIGASGLPITPVIGPGPANRATGDASPSAPDNHDSHSSAGGNIIPAAQIVWSSHRYFLLVATYPRLDIANHGAEYLAGHGVDCTIVKDKRGNYLLFATQGVDQQVDPAAKALRARVVAIGRAYPDAKNRHNGRGVWDDAYYYNVSRVAG